jgi:hypothetical protein
MGASAGPSLQGIGRGGDSNLVLEMDAHDAKSYPGEPTSNIVPNPNFVDGTTTTWQELGTGATLTAVADSNNPVNSPYILKLVRGSADASVYTNLIDKTFQGGSYTLSCWAKGDGTMSFGKYDNNSGWGSGGELAVTLTDEWQLITLYTSINGSDGTTEIKFYIGYTLTGTHAYFAGPQFEKKAYATPYVWDGYNGRPATTNLMIHGNVGTGTSFYDSSPSGHTVTTVNDTTHSAVQSKFNGGSFYFDGNGDYLTIPDSTDWDLGSDDFTIDAWIYPTSMTDYAGNSGTIICQDDNSSSKAWNLRLNSNGTLLFRYTTDGSNEIDKTSGATGISINNWYHVAVCRYGSSGGGTSYSTLEFFVDGVSKGTVDIAGDTIYSSSTSVLVGARGGPNLYFTGYMDEVRITKGTALWRGTFTPPTRRNLSAPVVDRSGSDNGGNFNTTDMTDVATYRVGEVIRPIDSAVWDFDGTDDEINMGHAGGAFIKDGVDRTIAQWVMSPTATATYMSSLGYRKSADETGGWMIYWRQGYIRIWAAGGSHSPEVAGNTFAANTIYHVVATWPGTSGQTIKLYINGEYISAADGTTGTSADSTSNELSIGRYGANTSFHYTGKVYNTQIYDTILTPQQVKENFNSQRSRFGV